MRGAFTLTLLAALVAGVARAAAPVADAIAYPIQGATSVAPCVVTFGGDGSTDADVADPFMGLEYRWEFGDPSSGSYQRGSRIGQSRDFDFAPIVSHVYDTPGAKTAELIVTDGTTEATDSVGFTCVDPDTEFSAAETWCVCDPTDAGCTAPSVGWLGCPLDTDDDGDCDVETSHCIKEEWDTAFLTNADVDGTTGRRVLFKRGYDQGSDGTSTVSFVCSGAANSECASNTPMMVGAFGSGARPKLRGGNTAAREPMLLLGARETIADVELYPNDDTSGIGFRSNALGGEGISLVRVRIEGRYHMCFNGGHAGASSTYNDHRQGIAQLECVMTGDNVDPEANFSFETFYGANTRGAFIESLIDGGGHCGNYLVRYPGNASTVFAHNDVRDPNEDETCPVGNANADNVMNIRGGAVGPLAHNVFHDNRFQLATGVGGGAVRVCTHQSCGSQVPPDDPSDPDFNASSYLFQRNLVVWYLGDVATEGATCFQLEGDHHVLRRNECYVDGRVGTSGGVTLVRVQGGATDLQDGSETTLRGGIVAHNNSLVVTDTNSATWNVCQNVNQAVTSNNECRANLIYAPNKTGSFNWTSGANWTADTTSLFSGATSAQRFTGCPFVGSDGACTLPAYSALEWDDLALRASSFITGGTAPHDNGWAGTVDFSLYLDAVQGTPVGASDVGAFEFDAPVWNPGAAAPTGPSRRRAQLLGFLLEGGHR